MLHTQTIGQVSCIVYHRAISGNNLRLVLATDYINQDSDHIMEINQDIIIHAKQPSCKKMCGP